ncbi:hypothetical protein A2U01_0029089, partial [Trifolium medium]|nr:hypothetical protein [Trifolium medium]
EPTYVNLTLEFLSSLSYTAVPNTASTVGTVKFRMFNKEYDLSINRMAGLLGFPYGDDVACEAPIETEVGPFWEQLTGHTTNTYVASMIHNPAIRYFRQILACTIFARENSNKVNAKEFFYMQAVFAPTRINSVPFMLSHMQAICTAKKGAISFGGLITSIARALELDNELANLEPLEPRFLNLLTVKNMHFVKARKQEGGFLLMVQKNAIEGVVLPCPDRTDVQNRANWLYDLNANPAADPMPMDIQQNVAADGDTN